MSEHLEPKTAATNLLSRALEVWARGYQVIPLPDPAEGHPPDASESIWSTKRQEREDVEQLFRARSWAKGVGVIQVSSAWSPFIGNVDWPAWNALLTEDVVHKHVDLGEYGVAEWLFTGKFEFFEQLERLRKAREAIRREAQAAEEKLKPPVGLPVTRVGEGDLSRLFSDPDVIRMIAPVLGIPERRIESGGFLCVIHQEQHPSAHLFQDDTGRFMYSCFHSLGLWVRPLPEVYYVQKTGNTDEKLKGPKFATWALRLLAEAGVLHPLDDVGLPELKDASDGERKVYEGLKLLFSVRWTYSPGEPAPFSWRFAEEWCGVAQATAGKAIQRFLKLGIIHAADKHKNTTLFLPGRGKRGIRIRFVGKGYRPGVSR
jgi:hypothetical protein